MIELKQLEQLVAIAEAGTLSKAAEELHLSQPALTRSIQRLESTWGVTLFDRQKNRIQLNETGELAVASAKQILEDVDQMTNTVRLFEKRQRYLTIGSCAPGPIIRAYSYLKKQYPDLSIEHTLIESKGLVAGLKEDRFQLIITDTPIDEPDFLCQKLCTEELFVAVEFDHPLTIYKEGLYAKDLAGQVMLLVKNIGIWHEVVLAQMPQTKFIPQEDVAVFNALVASSSIPSFATNLTLEYQNDPDNFVYLPLLDPEMHITFYACVRKIQRDFLPPSS
ncbi:LysR family transcriptional regulator [Enterococcus sp. AZ109]|uniref:LysR family transcriptional regulator n=1 Tax=Enterococcus sp. AZ109 TaxID=2774634 RepID=UPI003F27FFCA